MPEAVVLSWGFVPLPQGHSGSRDIYCRHTESTPGTEGWSRDPWTPHDPHDAGRPTARRGPLSVSTGPQLYQPGSE